jgi:predicted O-methyltransferase YrrM
VEYLRLFQSYLNYYFRSKTKFDVHSPFVFSFITDVLKDEKNYEAYSALKKLSNELLKNNALITQEDYGAGSKFSGSNTITVSNLFRNTSLSPKYYQLLFRITHYFKPETIIELGTGLGISAAGMALGNEEATVYTIEGNKAIADITKNNFEKFQLNNIQLITGKFDEQLPMILNGISKIDLAFIDGNHHRKKTVEYFHLIAEKCHNDSVIIFDDIRWSKGMYNAWLEIISDKRITLSFDLFRIGIVFFRKENRVKEHYMLYFW